jgi:cytochrome c-type biogenesis protein CcmH/NrfG
MRRDTLAFTIAGVVFGFVLGYMAAGYEIVPRPVPVGAAPAATTGAGSAPAGGGVAAAKAAIDPNEVQAMESLAARQPQDAAVRGELGTLYMDAQRWDEAIRWYGEALLLAPGNPDVTVDLGACYVHSGRPAEGLVRFDSVLKTKPDHRNARFNRGVALQQLGRAREAADAWDELLKLYPADTQLQRLRARIDEIRATTPAG